MDLATTQHFPAAPRPKLARLPCGPAAPQKVPSSVQVCLSSVSARPGWRNPLCRAAASAAPLHAGRAGMAVSRTNFRAGDRVRGAPWFDAIAGAVGTVRHVEEVSGADWAAQDLVVRFDRPVVILGQLKWTFCHSAHNFEFIGESPAEPRGGCPADPQPKRRRLTHKQPPPPAYRACDGCRYPGYLCTCAEGEPDDAAAAALPVPPPQLPLSFTPFTLMPTGAHYDETLQAWAGGSPPSRGTAGSAHIGSAPFSGRGRRLRDAP